MCGHERKAGLVGGPDVIPRQRKDLKTGKNEESEKITVKNSSFISKARKKKN